MHLAAESDAAFVVAALLAAKADPALGDDQGDTAMHCDWAACVQNYSVSNSSPAQRVLRSSFLFPSPVGLQVFEIQDRDFGRERE